MWPARDNREFDSDSEMRELEAYIRSRSIRNQQTPPMQPAEQGAAVLQQPPDGEDVLDYMRWMTRHWALTGKRADFEDTWDCATFKAVVSALWQVYQQELERAMEASARRASGGEASQAMPNLAAGTHIHTSHHIMQSGFCLTNHKLQYANPHSMQVLLLPQQTILMTRHCHILRALTKPGQIILQRHCSISRGV